MTAVYHILNGDALREQLPSDIDGEIIVARECLVDGPVNARSLEELFSIRASFLLENYGISKESYFEESANEFKRVLAIPSDSEVNLWFEEDLFCQVNLWFVCSLLDSSKLNLVLPGTDIQYGFGGLDTEGLLNAFKRRAALRIKNQLAELWSCYQSHNLSQLKLIAQELNDEYPYINQAAKAHLESIPYNGYLGRPKESLKEIMQDLDTENFGQVFQEFQRRESIYGLGDLQVKRLFDELLLSGS